MFCVLGAVEGVLGAWLHCIGMTLPLPFGDVFAAKNGRYFENGASAPLGDGGSYSSQ